MNTKKRFLISVCGVRDGENIRELLATDIDILGFVFCSDSPQVVKMIPSNSGLIPDYSRDRYLQQRGQEINDVETQRVKRLGIFADDMPQNIITRIYNYDLDYVQLQGDESPVMIDNLRRSVDPDIRHGIKIIKTLDIATLADFERCKSFEGHADLLCFRIKREGQNQEVVSWNETLLAAYHGELPFILSGNIGLNDAEALQTIRCSKCVGIEINHAFELTPGVKDIQGINRFISLIE